MKLTIPKQLKNTEFRFIKIRRNSKKAAEKKFQLSYNYKHDELIFKKYLKEATGYGVLCGQGNLAVVDCDTPKLAQRLLMRLSPTTFSVKTGSGGLHLYYLVPDLDKKIVLTDKKGVHHGEIQFTNFYVLGPGSLHPTTGNIYTVQNDVKIQTISKEKLFKAIGDCYKEKAEFIETEVTGLNWDIETVAKTLHGLDKSGDEWVGQHPVHGSDKGEDGTNFRINLEKNVWHCFRCNTGGDALSLIAVIEGLIDCEECVRGFFNNKRGKEIFLKARDIGISKYGFENARPVALFGSNSRRGELLTQNIANHIMQIEKFITVRDTTGKLPHIYVYKDGYYQLNGEDLIILTMKKLFNEQNVPWKIRYKNEILDYIKTENMVDREELNPPKYLLNFHNGSYDIKSKQLVPHKAKDYFLYKIPWNYKPQAECPKVMQYLESTLESEFIKLTQEIFGYCLMFDYRHAAIFYLYGLGGNGKSVWIKVLEHLLGPKNVANKSIGSLISTRFTSALLYGKLANICGELTNSVFNNIDMLKSLSAGDSIQAEFKGKDGFDFENKARIITACNSIPYCKDMTDGWYQRQYIIPFLKKFRYSAQEDTELLDKLLVKKEMEGLLAWSLEGLHRLLKNKRFSYPLDKKERYLMYQANVKYFVRNFYVKTRDRGDSIPVSDIWEHYRQWCEKNNVPLESENALGRELTYKEMKLDRITKNNKSMSVRNYIKRL